MQLDGGRLWVADAGGFAEFLDSILVVAGAFHRAGAGAVDAFGDDQGGDLVQVVGQFAAQSSGGNVRRPGRGTADQAQGLGERDLVRVQVGGSGRLGDERADGVVHDQVAVDLLVDQVGQSGP